MAVQMLALCHTSMGQACQVVADATSAACDCTVGATHTPEACPSCSPDPSSDPAACDGHSLPDGRQPIVPPAVLLPMVLIDFDPRDVRVYSLRAFTDLPPLPPSARLSLPLLI